MMRAIFVKDKLDKFNLGIVIFVLVQFKRGVFYPWVEILGRFVCCQQLNPLHPFRLQRQHLSKSQARPIQYL